jgi:dihydrofolate synthase/folylpolyglutamate synthase
MNAAQAVAYIHGAQYTGAKNGLENTKALLTKLHIPMTPVPAIHVAGTNGKGSVCAMLDSMLRACGLKVGLYTSPFLQFYNERIRINGVPVSDDILASAVTLVKEAADSLQNQGICPTAFEIGTAVSFLIFREEKVDIAVIEVGLGGRLDPTNVITPLVSVITALGMDHMAYLGDTLEKIAGEKAGIVKPGVPVALYPARQEAEAVVRSVCEQKQSPLTALRHRQAVFHQADAFGSRADFDLPKGKMEDVHVPLPGLHQVENALTALTAMDLLPCFPLSREAMRKGMERVRWPARLEWIGSSPKVLLDGAHNPQGVEALRSFADLFLHKEKRVLLTGVLREKINGKMIEDMAALADHAVTVTPDNHRAMQAFELASLLQEEGCAAEPAASLEEGLRLASDLAGPDGIIIAAGSLYLAGALRGMLGLQDESLA